MSRKYQICKPDLANTEATFFMGGKNQSVHFDKDGQAVVEAEDAEVPVYTRMGYTFSTEITIGERRKYDGITNADAGVRAHMENLEIRVGELVNELQVQRQTIADLKSAKAALEMREAAFDRRVAELEKDKADLTAKHSLERRRADNFELASAEAGKRLDDMQKALAQADADKQELQEKNAEHERTIGTLEMELERATAPAATESK